MTSKLSLDPTLVLKKRLDSEAPPQPLNSGKFHFAGQHLGEISLNSGIPFLSREGRQWIESRTEGIDSLQALCATGPPWQVRRGIDSTFLRNLGNLAVVIASPSRDAVEQSVCMYSGHPLKRIFPVIDEFLFNQTVELAYQSYRASPSVETVGAQACVLSFMALMALHCMCPLSNPPIDSDECAVKAEYLLPHVLHVNTIDVFQTYYMLVGSLPCKVLQISNFLWTDTIPAWPGMKSRHYTIYSLVNCKRRRFSTPWPVA